MDALFTCAGYARSSTTSKCRPSGPTLYSLKFPATATVHCIRPTWLAATTRFPLRKAWSCCQRFHSTILSIDYSTVPINPNILIYRVYQHLSCCSALRLENSTSQLPAQNTLPSAAITTPESPSNPSWEREFNIMEQSPGTSKELVQVRKGKHVLNVFKCEYCRRRKVKVSSWAPVLWLLVMTPWGWEMSYFLPFQLADIRQRQMPRQTSSRYHSCRFYPTVISIFRAWHLRRHFKKTVLTSASAARSLELGPKSVWNVNIYTTTALHRKEQSDANEKKSSTSEIPFPTPLYTSSQPGEGLQELLAGGTESQTQNIANLLENQQQ